MFFLVISNYNCITELSLNINLSLYYYQIIVVLFINMIIFINILNMCIIQYIKFFYVSNIFLCFYAKITFRKG
uniref:Uncharacterized protein n=1 Tax=Laurencieae sp. TaxID=2007162 RepID=A0A1Z1M2B5_9FLOR|nr:hypothetical protein [Laurencieae sp.]